MNQRLLLAVATMVGLILVTGFAFSFAVGTLQQRGAGDAAGGSPNLQAQEPSEPYYTVEPIPVGGNVKARTEQEEQIFQQAAEMVRRAQPVPAERHQFYDWLNQPDSPLRWVGWGCFVQQVTPTPEGWRITLWVTPFATRYGSIATVFNRFIEEYLWSNGELQYVRGYGDPRIGVEPAYAW